MNVEFEESFERDLLSMQEQLRKRVRAAIVEVQNAPTQASIRNVKKLKSSRIHYRIRVGNYRIGVEIERGTVTFVRCLHRKEIYRYFP